MKKNNFKRFKFLFILIVLALTLSLSAGIISADDNENQEEQVIRLAGEDRYATAAKIALEAFTKGTDYVIIARGDVYIDALAGSFLAGAADAPILLARTNSLPTVTVQALEKLEAETVLILGGESAISQEVNEEILDLGLATIRVGGEDRFDTAVKIMEYGFENFDIGDPEGAIIINGFAPADALAAGTWANKNQVPILMVRAENLPETTEEVLAELEWVNIIGGTAVVSRALEGELPQDSISRYAGEDRYATSVEVAKALFPEASNFTLVNGMEGLVDALAGSVLNIPILYAGLEECPAVVANYIDEILEEESMVYLLGGTAVVSTDLEEHIKALFQPEIISEVCPENSYVTFEDQKDGSALVTLVVQNELGEGISGFGMDNFEVISVHDPEPLWRTLTETDEGPYVSITDFNDHEDGTYTYRVTRPVGTPTLSFRVEGTVIEDELECVITREEEEVEEKEEEVFEVCPENSHVIFENQGDGSALVTLTVQDGLGNGIDGLGMEDFETYAEHLGEWNTLKEADEGPYIIIADFTDYGDGTYTYRVARPAGTLILSYRVEEIIIESELEATITETVDANNSSAKAEDQEDGSALVTLEVRNGFGNGILGLGMENIELGIEPDPLWTSLTDIHLNPDQPSIENFTDHGDGTYTYRVVRDDGIVTISIRVDEVIIETGVEVEVSGN